MKNPTIHAADSALPIGSYYSAQYTNWPPLPANFLNLPAVQIGENAFLLDDVNSVGVDRAIISEVTCLK